MLLVATRHAFFAVDVMDPSTLTRVEKDYGTIKCELMHCSVKKKD